MDKTEAYKIIGRKLEDENVNKVFYLLEKSHTETYLHSLHVGLLMALLCDELNVPEERADMLIKCALVHDVGKLDIEKSILDKTGSLTDEERKLVNKHPRFGYKTTRRMKFSRDISKRVLLHHWRANKEGYPKVSLLDKDLINDIELLAMCDMYSAIVQPRSYHKPYSSEYALSEISREQFDVKNLVAFKNVIKQNGDACFIAPLKKELK